MNAGWVRDIRWRGFARRSGGPFPPIRKFGQNKPSKKYQCGACGWAQLSAVSLRYLMRWGWSASAPRRASPVRLVVLVVALEPDDLAVALEGQDVGGDAVEEPAVVADDHGAAGEAQQRLLQRAQRVDVEVVGRLVEQQQVAAAVQQLGQVDAVALAAGEVADLLLLVGPLEVERRRRRRAR